MRVVFALTVCGGICLLTLAMWPGMIEDKVFGFPYFCAWLPLLGCWFLLLIGISLRDLIITADALGPRRWWGLRSTAIMFVTLGLLWLNVPQQVAFAFCYADLRGLVDTAPADEFRGGMLNRQVGPYYVDRYGADRRGGVFFRTAIAPDGFGPDQKSFGFAFRPNGKGSPFGNAHYRLKHLFGDWYVFATSDDW
jgi:hypothetical protein